MNVILSSPLLLTAGTFKSETISLTEAIIWVNDNNPTCYSAHATVGLLGIDATSVPRNDCESYRQALILKPNKRLEFCKEYSLDEIAEIGVTCMLITNLDYVELRNHYNSLTSLYAYDDVAIREAIVHNVSMHIGIINLNHYANICTIVVHTLSNDVEDILNFCKLLKSTCISDDTFTVTVTNGVYSINYCEPNNDPILGKPMYKYETIDITPIEI